MIRLMESEIVNERFVVVAENIPFRNVFDRIADKESVVKDPAYRQGRY